MNKFCQRIRPDCWLAA